MTGKRFLLISCGQSGGKSFRRIDRSGISCYPENPANHVPQAVSPAGRTFCGVCTYRKREGLPKDGTLPPAQGESDGNGIRRSPAGRLSGSGIRLPNRSRYTMQPVRGQNAAIYEYQARFSGQRGYGNENYNRARESD